VEISPISDVIMRSFLLATVVGLPLLIAACDGRSTVAYGDATSIIFATPDSVWSEVADSVHRVMEPRILTVREERTFELTHVSPVDPKWTRLRLFRQVLVAGRPEDPWVAPVVEAQKEPLPPLPAIIVASDVWARGQTVTAVVLPPDGGATELAALLPDLHRHFDGRFRDYARQRMFVSGRNDSLLAALRAEAGFGLLVPKVYEVRQPDASTYIFRNDNMTGGILERTILVTWTEGKGSRPAESAESALEWRDDVAAKHYGMLPQRTGRDPIETRMLGSDESGGLEVQGIWTGTDAQFPMAGPFITRIVPCPAQDRTYLLDAWLYAPGKSKYEYMLQLETILDSFECGA